VPAGPQAAAEIHAVDLGQPNIENDRVIAIDITQSQPERAVAGKIRFVALLFEILTDIDGEWRIVFDDQNMH
jgi:hypothetical protein